MSLDLTGTEVKMTKDEKVKFALELNEIETTYDERKKGMFTAGPGMTQAIQFIAVKKLVTLLCRILLAKD